MGGWVLKGVQKSEVALGFSLPVFFLCLFLVAGLAHNEEWAGIGYILAPIGMVLFLGIPIWAIANVWIGGRTRPGPVLWTQSIGSGLWVCLGMGPGLSDRFGNHAALLIGGGAGLLLAMSPLLLRWMRAQQDTRVTRRTD
jgi:hypothetical protein